MKTTIVAFSMINDEYPMISPDELIDHWEAYDHPSHANQRYEELVKRDDLHSASICSVLRSTDYTPEVTPEASTLASIILAAAKLREDSYDHAASDKAKAACESSPGLSNYLDFDRFYLTDIGQATHDAAKAAGQPELAYVAHLLLKATWNNALDWAKDPKVSS